MKTIHFATIDNVVTAALKKKDVNFSHLVRSLEVGDLLELLEYTLGDLGSFFFFKSPLACWPLSSCCDLRVTKWLLCFHES